MPPLPLIVVLGATASGKTRLALYLAQALGGEIINADAMAVYRGMEIGVAKPTPAERALAPHHCLDLCDCSEDCNLQRWFDAADTALKDIHARQKIPIVVGGSPLYLKTLLEGLSAGAPRDDALRQTLEAEYAAGPEAMLERLRRVDPVYAASRHANDQRRIVRALEVFQLTGLPFSQHHVTDGIRRKDLAPLLIGLQWPQEELHRRINARSRAMFAGGLVEEVRSLAPRLSRTARQAVGYKEVLGFLAGEYDQEKALEMTMRASRMLAKQQRTWYRRFADINWLAGEAPDLDIQSLDLCRQNLSSIAT